MAAPSPPPSPPLQSGAADDDAALPAPPTASAVSTSYGVLQRRPRHRRVGPGRLAPAPVPAAAQPAPAPTIAARPPAATATQPAPAPLAAAKAEPTPPAAPGAPPAQDLTIGLGLGLDRLPRWMGSAARENRTVPYLHINWQDRFELSTVNGLILDAINGSSWHGGLVGTMIWGRSTSDLAKLPIPTLKNTFQGGAYLEYAWTRELTTGLRLRYDLNGTRGAYADLYAEIDLPAPEPFSHSLRLAAEAMNATAMGRFFGLSALTATGLGVAPYQPGGGLSRYALTYDGFIPTSEHTGIAFAATIGKLTGRAADSPLVRNFGSASQKDFMAAFVVHF